MYPDTPGSIYLLGLIIGVVLGFFIGIWFCYITGWIKKGKGGF